jgi:predicted transposase YdaD
MDMTEALDNSVEESDEWFYNYFGRDNIAKVKEEAKEEVREEVKEEVREETREEERRKNILNMLRLHYSITSIGNALQMPEDEVIRIARENNIPVSD